MAQNMNEMLQEIVNMPYDRKLAGAKYALAECYGTLTKIGIDENKATMITVTFLAAAVAVDGKFTSLEKKFLKDLFSVDLENLVNSMDSKAYDAMDAIVDAMNATDKSKFCLLATYVLAVDDTINRDELNYLIKLMK